MRKTLVLTFLLCAGTLLFAGEPAPAGPGAGGPNAAAVAPVQNAPANPPAEVPWKKIDLKHVALPTPRQILSPGYFDREGQNTIVFDKKRECPDVGLPPVKGRNGPIAGRMVQNFVWLDFNGDGKPGGDETRPIDKEGWSEPFQYEAMYDGGASAPLIFRLKQIIEHEKFAVVRSTVRVGDIEGQKIVLLDDSGNGRFNDFNKDSMLLGEAPVSMLSKHILIGDTFYEILPQESGLTLEYRPARLETGFADLLDNFTPPQKSETLRIHTLIIAGPNGSFAMNPKRPNAKVPVGAYDIVFGIFERAKEIVYMKNGEKTTFSVNAEKLTAPAFGGAVQALYEFTSDGKEVIIGAPTFVGSLGERYFPENYNVIPLNGSVAQVYEDERNFLHRRPFGGRRYDLLPDGKPEPLTFKPYRNHADEYEATVTYNSGILGSVISRSKLQYVPAKKPSSKK